MDGAAVKVKLLFFAKSRELVGKKEVDFELLHISTPKFILKQIIAEFPELCVIQNNLLLSLNEDYIEGEESVVIKAGDEIAVIPPISGG